MLIHALIRPTTQSRADLTEAAVLLETAGVGALVIDRGPAPSAYEPTTLAALLARQTTHLGLVVADTTHFGYPYNVARRLASLDHLSRGRAGWLISSEAVDADRGGYERSGAGSDEAECAAEYRAVVEQLFLSWERGAERPDKGSGRYQDDTRIHPIGYRSERFQIAGALNVPRSPQGVLPVVTVARTAAHVEAAARADVVILEPADPAGRGPLLALARDALLATGRTAHLLVGVTTEPAGGGVGPFGGWEQELAAAVDLGADGVALIGDGSTDWARQVVGALEAAEMATPGSLPDASPKTLAESLGLTTEPEEWSAA